MRNILKTVTAFGLLISTYSGAGIWDLFAKLKKDIHKSKATAVVGVRGSNVSEQKTSSLVKPTDLYWAE